MIKKKSIKKDKTVKITFALAGDDARLPAAVLGDFNEWNSTAHPLRKRNNGTFSTTVTVKQGSKCCFRYRSDDGLWFNDDEADSYEVSDLGSENGVVET